MHHIRAFVGRMVAGITPIANLVAEPSVVAVNSSSSTAVYREFQEKAGLLKQ